jgi:hypothetical protein
VKQDPLVERLSGCQRVISNHLESCWLAAVLPTKHLHASATQWAPHLITSERPVAPASPLARRSEMKEAYHTSGDVSKRIAYDGEPSGS